MLAEAVAEREEVVLAVVALALADRAVQPRVEALAVRAPERVGVVAWVPRVRSELRARAVAVARDERQARRRGDGVVDLAREPGRVLELDGEERVEAGSRAAERREVAGA